MRTANLDKMLEQINPFKSIFDKYLYNSVEALGEACKVEAIPVEWIEKWIETDRNTKRRTPYYYKRLFRSRLKMMLDDWRKENGRADL